MTDKKLYSTELLGTDSGFIQQVTGLFVQHIPVFCANLVSGFAEENWQQVYFHAHKMKASIDLFGIDSLKETIRKVEKISREETGTDELPILVQQIQDVITECTAQIKNDFGV